MRERIPEPNERMPNPEELIKIQDQNMSEKQVQQSEKREWDIIRDKKRKHEIIDYYVDIAAKEQAESMRSKIEEQINKRYKPEVLAGMYDSFVDNVVMEVRKQLRIMYYEYLTLGDIPDIHLTEARRGNVTLDLLLDIHVWPNEEKVEEIKKKIIERETDDFWQHPNVKRKSE